MDSKYTSFFVSNFILSFLISTSKGILNRRSSDSQGKFTDSQGKPLESDFYRASNLVKENRKIRKANMALYFPVMSSIMYLTFFDYLREVNLGILRKNEKESFQIFFYVSIPCPRNMNVKINNSIICSFKESGKFDEMLFPL